MKRKVLILSACLLTVLSGSAKAIWVGGAGTWDIKVYEIYLADQNTLQFSVKNDNGDWVVWNDANTVTTNTTGVNRLFTISALDVGHGFFMQLHAQLLTAIETNKHIGFEYNNSKVWSLTIYNAQ